MPSGISYLWSSHDVQADNQLPSNPQPPSIAQERAMDTSKIIYPSSTNHPSPAPYPIIVLSLGNLSLVSRTVTNKELLDSILGSLRPWVREDEKAGYVLVVLAAEGLDGGRKWPGVAWWVWTWKRLPGK
jgi:hypothetical protein